MITSPLLAFAQNALDPAGPQAGYIESLWWLYHCVAVVIWVLVIAVMLIAIAKRHPTGDDEHVDLKPEPAREKRMTVVVTACVGLTVVILFVLLVGEFLTGRRLFAMNSEQGREITVNARQWWWEVTYNDSTASNSFTTANEIHIPVGVPIKFNLNGIDVIHSFWVPNLHGKKD